MKRKEVDRVSEILFRECHGTKCDISTLSRRTGIPVCTLRRYKKEPEIIPLGRLMLIADAMDVTPGDAGFLITGRVIK